jgi:hypothetical protein
LNHFSLSWTGVSAVLASLVVLFAFSCIGAIVGKHRDFRAADPLIGWGIATGFLTIVGVAFPGWLPHAALVLGAASIFAMMLAFRRKELPGGKIFWASVLLAVPWLLLIVGQNVAEWDDFTHWLPNASYLYRFAAFPRTDLPAPISFWPAALALADESRRGALRGDGRSHGEPAPADLPWWAGHGSSRP